MILEQKIEHLYIEIDKPESLSYSLAEYWNEEIKDTKLIRKSVQILKDIRLPESSKEKTNALYRRIEKKLSAIRQMLKDCVKRYSSADPIDREIYRFTRIIERTIKGSSNGEAGESLPFLFSSLEWVTTAISLAKPSTWSASF